MLKMLLGAFASSVCMYNSVIYLFLYVCMYLLLLLCTPTTPSCPCAICLYCLSQHLPLGLCFTINKNHIIVNEILKCNDAVFNSLNFIHSSIGINTC